MGQIGSVFRRRDEEHLKNTQAGVALKNKKIPMTIFDCVSTRDIVASNIPEVFLVHEAKSSQFVDEDGDVANEFYLEEGGNEGRRRRLLRLIENLRPQKTERHPFPRLHPDLPIVMVEVKS